MAKLIYHITTDDAWANAQSAGEYMPNEYWADGFIHASYYWQLKQVADFIFSHHNKMLVLEIDTDLLDCEIKVENTTGGEELFPHIYGVLPTEVVAKTFYIENGQDGYEVPP